MVSIAARATSGTAPAPALRGRSGGGGGCTWCIPGTWGRVCARLRALSLPCACVCAWVGVWLLALSCAGEVKGRRLPPAAAPGAEPGGLTVGVEEGVAVFTADRGGRVRSWDRVAVGALPGVPGVVRLLTFGGDRPVGVWTLLCWEGRPRVGVGTRRALPKMDPRLPLDGAGLGRWRWQAKRSRAKGG